MAQEEKKQFSLSIAIRILLGLLVVTSIGIFGSSLMRVNELKKEEAALESALNNLIEIRQELNELLGSAAEVDRLLSDYEEYRRALESDTAVGETLEELEMRMEDLRELIHSSKYKDHIVRIAKEKLGLYFPDEEIVYNDQNR